MESIHVVLSLVLLQASWSLHCTLPLQRMPVPAIHSNSWLYNKALFVTDFSCIWTSLSPPMVIIVLRPAGGLLGARPPPRHADDCGRKKLSLGKQSISNFHIACRVSYNGEWLLANPTFTQHHTEGRGHSSHWLRQMVKMLEIHLCTTSTQSSSNWTAAEEHTSLFLNFKCFMV